MKSILVLIFAWIVSLPADAASPVPMEVFEGIKVEEATGKPVTAEQVQRAILTAARARGWEAQEGFRGQIAARIVVRGRFRVRVDIPYSAHEFSIKYVSSENLDYRPTPAGAQIHRNYNKWVATLVNDIKGRLILI